MARRPYSKSKLNEFLALVGAEIHDDLNDDGEAMTREEAVARLIFKKALGWTEKKVVQDEHGNTANVEEYHPPENWALQYVFERREGKAPTAEKSAEDRRRMTAADQVAELAVARLNDLAETAGTTSSGPPKYRPGT